jgi:inhibitor of KinA
VKQSYSIFSIGDSGITIDLGDRIDEPLNRMALTIQDRLAALNLPGVKDIIVAYSSVSVLYDPVSVVAGGAACREGAFICMKKRLEQVWLEASAGSADPGSNGRSPGFSGSDDPGFNGNIIRIPVCYETEFGPDQGLLTREKGLLPEDIVRLHTSKAYRVYMIGFLPGFPYLGKVDPGLEISRKERPVPVAAGGVGIAGNQTGIYPVNSPGGWQIIGRTPLKLFDPHAEAPVRLKIGDWVQFFSVTREAFQELASGGLETYGCSPA